MNNNTFNINRFGLLVKRDLQQDWKKYLLQALGVFTTLFVVYMLNGYSQYSREIAQVEHYWGSPTNFANMINSEYIRFGLLIFVIFFLVSVSMTMQPISSKRRRTDYLMLPSSAFEKYLSRILIHTVGFVLVFFVSFYLVDCIRVAVYSISYPEMVVEFVDLKAMWGGGSKPSIHDNTIEFCASMSGIIYVVSFFTLGTTFWQKNALVKNVLAFVTMLSTIALFGRLVMKVFFNDNLPSGNINVSNEDVYIVVIIICGVFAIFNWGLAYFRFKESELIERW